MTFKLLRPGKRTNGRRQKGRVMALHTTKSGMERATVQHDGGPQDGYEETVAIETVKKVR